MGGDSIQPGMRTDQTAGIRSGVSDSHMPDDPTAVPEGGSLSGSEGTKGAGKARPLSKLTPEQKENLKALAVGLNAAAQTLKQGALGINTSPIV